MIPGFEAIVEERIKKAQEQGEFDNLKGLSRPLNLEDQNIPEPWRLPVKILKNAGFLPPELELRKSIQETRKILENCDDDAPQRHIHQKKLNYLLTKLAMIRQARGCVMPITDGNYKQDLIQKLS